MQNNEKTKNLLQNNKQEHIGMTIHGIQLPTFYYKKGNDPKGCDCGCNSCPFGRMDENDDYHCSIIQEWLCTCGINHDCKRQCDGKLACDIEINDMEDFECPIFKEAESNQ